MWNYTVTLSPVFPDRTSLLFLNVALLQSFVLTSLLFSLYTLSFRHLTTFTNPNIILFCTTPILQPRTSKLKVPVGHFPSHDSKLWTFKIKDMTCPPPTYFNFLFLCFCLHCNNFLITFQKTLSVRALVLYPNSTFIKS